MSDTKKSTSSARPIGGSAPDHTVGSRTLDDAEDVWNYNAWYVSHLTRAGTTSSRRPSTSRWSTSCSRSRPRHA